MTMIPAFNISGVLPPFDVAVGPASPTAMSPYPVPMTDVVRRFATTTERVAMVSGLMDYRESLISAGIDDGFQWLDGSFVEDVENLRARPPGDVDVVTFAHRPTAHSSVDAWNVFVSVNTDLFDPRVNKSRYRCDAYFIDLNLGPKILVNSTRYWFGLFSHQRATALWKGMLQVPLQSDDAAARMIL